jgi:SAM-dependent methyltransferase
VADLQHQIWLKTLKGQLFTAPIEHGSTCSSSQTFDVLDVGCGSGSWAIDLALKYPHLRILGVDITPPKLPEDAQLTNITFLKADVEEHWDFAANVKFGYIHGRMLQSGIHDWPALLQKCWEHLAFDGWLELIDVEHPFRSDSLAGESLTALPFVKFGYAAEKAWNSNGLDYRATSKHMKRLETLGFQNVSGRSLRWPLGPWDKTEDEHSSAGDIILANFSRFIAAAGTSILRSGKPREGYVPMSEESAQQLLRETTNDLEMNWKVRKYWLSM